ncbi:MAG: hypothetical protein DYH08_01965 [Actinobacteria bacterium ATB1]|nr:hypothetical protein [Actinobacteria bacterium ATB1]
MSEGRGSAPGYRPVLRHNPFGLPSVVAEGRSFRPHDSRRHSPEGEDRVSRTAHHDPSCPFCEGNEDQTPPEVDAFRRAGTAQDSPGWSVRVVPNLYPAFLPDSGPDSGPDTGPASGNSSVKAGATASAGGHPAGLFAEVPARGRHEVAIHSPDHAARLADLGPERLGVTIEMWQKRLSVHSDEGLAYTVLAVNEGREAGASLAHPHAQLFATDFVPPAVSEELDRREDWRAHHGRPLLEATVEAEAEGPRRVDAEAGLLAWTPYWSRTRYEVWIAPLEPDSESGAFRESTNRDSLAELLGRVTRRIRDAVRDPALNVVLSDVPHGLVPGNPSSWYLRILPRTQVEAGYELGSGVHIVTVSPEQAAADLREA